MTPSLLLVSRTERVYDFKHRSYAVSLWTDARRPWSLQTRNGFAHWNQVELKRAQRKRNFIAIRAHLAARTGFSANVLIYFIIRDHVESNRAFSCFQFGLIRNLEEYSFNSLPHIPRSWDVWILRLFAGRGLNSDDSKSFTELSEVLHLKNGKKKKKKFFFYSLSDAIRLCSIRGPPKCDKSLPFSLLSQRITAMLQRRVRLSLSKSSREDLSAVHFE